MLISLPVCIQLNVFTLWLPEGTEQLCLNFLILRVDTITPSSWVVMRLKLVAYKKCLSQLHTGEVQHFLVPARFSPHLGQDKCTLFPGGSRVKITTNPSVPPMTTQGSPGVQWMVFVKEQSILITCVAYYQKGQWRKSLRG